MPTQSQRYAASTGPSSPYIRPRQLRYCRPHHLPRHCNPVHRDPGPLRRRRRILGRRSTPRRPPIATSTRRIIAAQARRANPTLPPAAADDDHLPEPPRAQAPRPQISPMLSFLYNRGIAAAPVSAASPARPQARDTGHAHLFKSIVLEGNLAPKGMARFDDVLRPRSRGLALLCDRSACIKDHPSGIRRRHDRQAREAAAKALGHLPTS